MIYKRGANLFSFYCCCLSIDNFCYPFACGTFYSVVAIRNAASPKRHLHELQQTTQHSKCRLESEHQFLPAQECDTKSSWNSPVFHSGKLAEELDFIVVDGCHGRSFHLEIHPIQKQGSLSGHGLLRGNSQRGCRDSEAQHGSRPVTGLSKHADVASLHKSQVLYPLWRQY